MAESLIDIDRLIDKALRSIYEGSPGYFDESLWKITTGELNKAVDSVSNASKHRHFTNKLKYQNSVFSAFKSAHETTTLRHLREASGAKSFAEFREKALSITGDYNKAWLKAEYRVAKARTRSAINYQDALQDADIYPNIEYMPSRASQPRQDHRGYYGTILSIDDPWWDTHLPPSAWGCQCWWKTTDAPSTLIPAGLPDDVSPGLDIHPGKTGRLFSNSHPYFAEMDHAAASIMRENVAAIHGVDPGSLRIFQGHRESKGCYYSLQKLGSEYETNTAIGRAFASLGNSVELFDYRNIDSRVNGIWNEFKAIKPSKNAIEKAIQRTNQQFTARNITGDITLKFSETLIPGIVLNAIKGRIGRLNPMRIDRIHFILNEKYIGTFTPEELLRGAAPF